MESALYDLCLDHARYRLPPEMSAEDLVHDAWLKARHGLDPERPEHERLAYLRRAIEHAAIDSRRRIARRALDGALDEEQFPCPRRMEDEALDRVTLAPYLERALAEPGLAALLLHASGWSQDEIAARAGTSRQAVKIRIWRWRQAHREA